MEEAAPEEFPWKRSSKIRLAVVSAILFTSVASVMYFEVTDPLECGEHRVLLDPPMLGLIIAVVALLVAVLFPPRLRMRGRPDEVTASVLMVSITVILALFLYLSAEPIC